MDGGSSLIDAGGTTWISLKRISISRDWCSEEMLSSANVRHEKPQTSAHLEFTCSLPSSPPQHEEISLALRPGHQSTRPPSSPFSVSLHCCTCSGSAVFSGSLEAEKNISPHSLVKDHLPVSGIPFLGHLQSTCSETLSTKQLFQLATLRVPDPKPQKIPALQTSSPDLFSSSCYYY